MTTKGEIAAFAPATISNVGPGFDCFGFPVEGLGDIVRLRLSDSPGVRVVDICGVVTDLPRDPTRNTAAVAAASLWNARPERAARYGLELIVEKGLPACSGLGSSAASAVAGAVAAAAAIARLGEPEVSRAALFAAALDGEAVAAGARHADNVAPALYGGFVIVRGVDPPAVTRFVPALALWLAVVTPELSIATKAAREVLPPEISRRDAVAQVAHAASLIVALQTGDWTLWGESHVDRIAEPRRAPLIRGYDAVRAAALTAGAVTCAISGSGPTLYAAARDQMAAERVAAAMVQAFASVALPARQLVTQLAHDGAKVL